MKNLDKQNTKICIVGGGLAGSECALSLAGLGFNVDLFEMRPQKSTAVHTGDELAELVCSNSLKSTKPASAAGMLKDELYMLGSNLLDAALESRVAAGGALAVNREEFSGIITHEIYSNERINLIRKEINSLDELVDKYDYVVLATGPLTSDALMSDLSRVMGEESLAFYDASAPIVMADSIDMSVVFRQSRYEEGGGDYLNAPFNKEQYESFIDELVAAKRVIAKDFESKDLFQACQPIEEIARKGRDAARFGPLKPVGLTDPATGRRPWAALQLRAEDAHGQSFNLVGFQTNLTFPEQKRVFSMIPGLENAEFARYGVMHANTFIDAPRMLDACGRLVGGRVEGINSRVYVAGQLAGTEGYCEAIRSGLHVALSVASDAAGVSAPELPRECAYGALMAYASDPGTVDYQPMHVNFGIMEPLQTRVRNKGARYEAYAARGREALFGYLNALDEAGLLCETARERRDSVKRVCAEGCGCPAAVAGVVASAMDAAGKQV